MLEHSENSQNLVGGGLKIQKLKFGSILLTDDSPVDKENSI
jgi:hypothetical protein